MRLASIMNGGRVGVAVEVDGGWRASYLQSLDAMVKAGPDALRTAADAIARDGEAVDIAELTFLTPVDPPKIVCVGLNYADHAAEANMAVPDHPTLFSRFASSLVAAGDPILLPRVSTQLDFEGELAVVIGRGGRHIAPADALAHVAGYACFNDASIRDYQLRTTQWMLGKNFDGTGAFGPFLVTPDARPDGASGLTIETRLNGTVVQKSSTDQLIFDVRTLIAEISAAMTLVPGDLIVTGTPAGVGNARTPKLFMKEGDSCEVEIENIGVLRNGIVAHG